jgi:hypothetical protein
MYSEVSGFGRESHKMTKCRTVLLFELFDGKGKRLLFPSTSNIEPEKNGR